MWVPNSSQDPFGKSGARQEDRDQAALRVITLTLSLTLALALDPNPDPSPSPNPNPIPSPSPSPSPSRSPSPVQAALFTARYAEALEKLRKKSFKGSDKVRV